MRVSTVLGAVLLVLIITNEAVSACRLLKSGRFYMRGFAVLDLAWIGYYYFYKLAWIEWP